MSQTPSDQPVFSIRVWKTARIITYVAGTLSALILSFSILMLTVMLKDVREELECRFDLSADVTAIKDQIDVSVARIVEAAVLIDDPSTSPEEAARLSALIPQEASRIRELIRDLQPAINRRNAAVENCRVDTWLPL